MDVPNPERSTTGMAHLGTYLFYILSKNADMNLLTTNCIGCHLCHLPPPPPPSPSSASFFFFFPVHLM
jgi:hypothetical protein